VKNTGDKQRENNEKGMIRYGLLNSGKTMGKNPLINTRKNTSKLKLLFGSAWHY